MRATITSHLYSLGLSVSVVVYRPDFAQLAETLASLATACDALRVRRPDFPVHLFVVDNGGLPDRSELLATLGTCDIEITVISGHGNIGYGRGHNLAIEQADSYYHLVLNPDISLDRDALSCAVDFFEVEPEAGLITPWIGDELGRQQYLCRRYPSLLDLFVRGFLPACMRKGFARRLARYEMRDVINPGEIVWSPPIVSGCFMLFRTTVLKRLDGFDKRYFLYFEDYDLSLRTHSIAQVVYVPAVRVLHHGGGAARKGSVHIRMFVSSAYKFFSRFGWKFL